MEFADESKIQALALVSPLKRTAIFVRNIETSSLLYERVFGYELWVDGEMDGSEDIAVFRLVGLAPGRCRYRVVRANRTDYGMIGFFEYADDTMGEIEKPHGRVSRGETCLVFLSPHMDEVYRRLQEEGAEIVCPPMMLTYRGRPIQREMTFYDRDRVMVNVIEQNITVPLT